MRTFRTTRERFGLPTIRGTVVLADAETGEPLAMMDSASVTALRTGAATAVAAKYLARPDSRSATVVGCGAQGAIQLAAIAAVLPLERVWVLDADPVRAQGLAARAQADLGIRVSVATDLHAALRESDVCVTCTPSRRPFVFRDDVPPGVFIAAVGADNRGKQELEPALVASSTLVVDVLEQCAEIGELQHALAAGLMTRDGRPCGALGCGRRPAAGSNARRRDHGLRQLRAPRCRTSPPPSWSTRTRSSAAAARR